MINRRLNSVKGGSRRLGWRILGRSLSLKRPQVLVTLLSLTIGAAVAAMLLNLYGDAQAKMTREFRAFGANLILSPSGMARESGNPAEVQDSLDASLMNEDVLEEIRRSGSEARRITAVGILHAVARARNATDRSALGDSGDPVIVVGTDFTLLHQLYPAWRLSPTAAVGGLSEAVIGEQVAEQLFLERGDDLELEIGVGGASAQIRVKIAAIVSTGGPEDGQVFLPLARLQEALGIDGGISLAELRVDGSTQEIEAVAARIADAFPKLDVRPVREIVYSEGQVLNTVRWLLLTLTMIILAITALCLIATITAIVLERQREIGLMKALGASDRLLMGFFLAEVGVLASAGSLVGFGLGAILSRFLGVQLFGIPLDLHWPALPWVTLTTVGVALVAAWSPVRVVRRIRPAIVLKGE
ncbi:MAG: ABC transporter permease [Acidobacteria bacterium]|nr:ABC transporter permease [Acidobacteriota bacterium]